MRQAIERMEYHGYTAVPVIDEQGYYLRTLSEGDFLWKLKNNGELTFLDSSKILVKEVPSKRHIAAVHINASMEDLLQRALAQNFVPVIDDTGVFIGIVTRSDIMRYVIQQKNTIE